MAKRRVRRATDASFWRNVASAISYRECAAGSPPPPPRDFRMGSGCVDKLHPLPTLCRILTTSVDVSGSQNSKRRKFTDRHIGTPNFHLPGRIRLLDVGSCYNPFMKYEDFLAVGIDIVPAVETVYKCDFLNLQIQRPLQLAPDAFDAFVKQLKSPIDYLPAELFHVVVFSLLLSYFPSRYQRWICCKKAHELLELNGLLLIITPDSSHQNRHAMMMKSWKIAIESLGFKRMTYSKFSHMHLMAFRKTSLKTTIDLLTRNYPDMLYIPQDFNTAAEEASASPCGTRSEVEDEQVAYTFSELPDAPYDSDSGESQSGSMAFYEFEDPILLMS
ncbi:unnamed protein product [Ranitomeya imitator]|uniref:S-adenosylmethionine sensor upstream of mTORC1 n=1 Tax=Ranitomeya imitator TaxID=111125 RepID=A0ABN9LNQ0_9NEOB|nr:unnamed protein product [Ranitomeya imitator]